LIIHVYFESDHIINKFQRPCSYLVSDHHRRRMHGNVSWQPSV